MAIRMATWPSGRMTRGGRPSCTAFLQSQDWQVIRFWNTDLLENIDGVLDSIQLTLIHISKSRDGST